jgi:hypothetical protein
MAGQTGGLAEDRGRILGKAMSDRYLLDCAI